MNRKILHLAVPSIISNITVPLLGLVDVAIVGHIGDASYIGAIAVGSMLFNVIYWLFGFLRMGTSGMTSQALGRRDFAEVQRLLARSLSIGVGIGLLFFILQRWMIGCGLWAMSPEADVVELARRYCYVCIWGAPAVLGLYGFTGWFIGMQNTRIPMVVSLTQNVVNIIASLMLVFVCRMTVEGVALGTVIAQWWGLLMACVLYRLYYRRLGKYDYRHHIFDSEPLKRFFSLNRDIFLRTVCLVAVNLFFTAAGSRESTLVLAVNTLLMTLFTIFSYFMDGFAYAAEALSGKYYGAGNRVAFREVVKRTMMFGVGVAVGFTLLYIIGPLALLSILFFNLSFVALGYNYVPTEELLDKEEEESAALADEITESSNGLDAEPTDGKENLPSFSQERQAAIKEKLDKWCEELGYKDTTVNMFTLSRSLNISKNELSRYFTSCLNSTFRIWLSEVRFEAAKKMMLDYPDYNNDIISAECGFSSRSYLYRIFKEKEGCSPTVWRAKIQ